MMMKPFFILVFILFIFTNVKAQTFTISHDGYARTFLVHLPIGYNGNEAYPLIIAMHGGFGTSLNMERQSQLSKKSDEADFIVVYPQGIKGGLLKISSWNAGDCCGWTAKNEIDDIGFIELMIDELSSKFNINEKRIYATGLSNGGMMSYRLACELSDKIAAIAPVATTMVLPSCNLSTSVPMIHFQSYLDSNIPYLGGIGDGVSKHYNPPLDSVLNVFATNNHCSILNDTMINDEKYSLVKWHLCDCDAEIHLYMTRDGGHSWPGGQESGLVDTASIHISATDLMWDFLKQYSLECKPNSVNNLQDVDVSISPNPTNAWVKVDIKWTQDFKMKVYNIYGKELTLPITRNIVDFTNQKSGIYFLHIRSGMGDVMKKIVVF